MQKRKTKKRKTKAESLERRNAAKKPQLSHDVFFFPFPFSVLCFLPCSPYHPPPLPQGGEQVLQPEYQRVEREPIVRERISKRVIEEVQPIIVREREQVHVIRTIVPIKGE